MPVKTVQPGIGHVLSVAVEDVPVHLRATRPVWPRFCERAGSLFPAAAPFRFLNGGNYLRSLLSTLSRDDNPDLEHRHQTLRTLPNGLSRPRLPLASSKAEVSKLSCRP